MIQLLPVGSLIENVLPPQMVKKISFHIMELSDMLEIDISCIPDTNSRERIDEKYYRYNVLMRFIPDEMKSREIYKTFMKGMLQIAKVVL